MKWWLYRNGEVSDRAYSKDELRELDLPPDMLVQPDESEQDWTRAKNVDALSDLFEKEPTPNGRDSNEQLTSLIGTLPEVLSGVFYDPSFFKDKAPNFSWTLIRKYYILYGLLIFLPEQLPKLSSGKLAPVIGGWIITPFFILMGANISSFVLAKISQLFGSDATAYQVLKVLVHGYMASIIAAVVSLLGLFGAEQSPLLMLLITVPALILIIWVVINMTRGLAMRFESNIPSYVYVGSIIFTFLAFFAIPFLYGLYLGISSSFA